MRPAVVSGIATGDAPSAIGHWVFSLLVVTVPEGFANVNSSQSSSRF